ncbi:cache domain-containing protein [Bacillus sp. SL00103]
MKQRKKVIVSATKAIVKNGKVIGVAGLDLKLSSIQSYINEQEIPYKGTAFLVDNTGTIWRIQHSKEKTYRRLPLSKKRLITQVLMTAKN